MNHVAIWIFNFRDQVTDQKVSRDDIVVTLRSVNV